VRRERGMEGQRVEGGTWRWLSDSYASLSLKEAFEERFMPIRRRKEKKKKRQQRKKKRKEKKNEQRKNEKEKKKNEKEKEKERRGKGKRQKEKDNDVRREKIVEGKRCFVHM